MKKCWLNDKKVVITGATSGIGRRIVDILLNEYNCYVLGVSKNQEKAQKVFDDITKSSDKYLKYCFDVGDKTEWGKFANHLKDISFIPDLIINNAGILPKFKSVTKTDVSEIELVLKTDFLSSVYSFKSLYTSDFLFPAFVNVSSSASLATLAGTSGYTSAKCALRAFTECLSYELKRKTYVSIVCPGFTKTDIFRNQNQDVNTGIIGKISMPAQKMAKKIVKGIAKKKRRMVFGKDAKLMNVLARLFPKKSVDISSGVLKRTKMALFEEVFKD